MIGRITKKHLELISIIYIMIHFFLEAGDSNSLMGVQGKFASEQIKHVNKFLENELQEKRNDSSMSLENAENIVNLVGEDVLRRMLKEKLEKS